MQTVNVAIPLQIHGHDPALPGCDKVCDEPGTASGRRCAGLTSFAIKPNDAGYFTHSPLRKTGTLLPSAKMPSMSVSAEPIIQSI